MNYTLSLSPNQVHKLWLLSDGALPVYPQSAHARTFRALERKGLTRQVTTAVQDWQSWELTDLGRTIQPVIARARFDSVGPLHIQVSLQVA